MARELTRRINDQEASAADIGAAIKFLKDNAITASIEDNSNLSELEQKLKDRAAKRNGLSVVRNDRPLTDDEADEVIDRIARTA